MPQGSVPRGSEAIAVTCCDRIWVLREATAHDWIMAIAVDPQQLSEIFPGMVRDEDMDAMQWCVEHVDNMQRRWLNVARKAVARGSRREDWWWTTNLVGRCLQAWAHINGTLLRQGVDSRNMAFPDWLDAAFSLIWERCEEGERTKLEMELSFPPKGVSMAPNPKVARQSLKAFSAD